MVGFSLPRSSSTSLIQAYFTRHRRRRTSGNKYPHALLGTFHVRQILLGIPFALADLSLYSARTIHSRLEHRYINSFAAELIGLFIFFLLWVAGAAIATVSDLIFRSNHRAHALPIHSTPEIHQMSTLTGEISPRAGASRSAGSLRLCLRLHG
jgi:hypothetical protein